MANKIPRVPVREQDPKVRVTNFEEVCYGYDLDEARLEASRCLGCKKPRCVEHCPVSLQIPQFIAQLRDGNLAEAARIIAQDSSLPSVCGRVCPQETQCEGSCILGVKGESVAIGKLERFVGDWSIEHGAEATAPAPSNGRKVAVVGSGPAGLACAADLAKMGYEVKIFEALHKVGGVLVYGIPEFRLPKERIVAREIAQVERLGVGIETDVIVGRTVTIDSLLDDEGYDAVFIGSGAGLPRFMGIPGENLNGVVSANEFLTRANLMHAYDKAYDTPIYVGQRVVVVGGGNVAMDAVRTAKRSAQALAEFRRLHGALQQENAAVGAVSTIGKAAVPDPTAHHKVALLIRAKGYGLFLLTPDDLPRALQIAGEQFPAAVGAFVAYGHSGALLSAIGCASRFSIACVSYICKRSVQRFMHKRRQFRPDFV